MGGGGREVKREGGGMGRGGGGEDGLGGGEGGWSERETRVDGLSPADPRENGLNQVQR